MRTQKYQSRFIEMFSSRQLPLKHLPDLSENLDKKRVPITSGDRKSGKYPYYGASGIVDYVNDYIFDETLLLISEDGANLKDRVTPIAFQASGKFWVNNHAHVLRFDSSAMMLYIEYLINGMDIEKYLTGMAQPKLNQKELNAIPIPVPSDSELQRFQTLIIQADKSKFNGFKSRFIEMFGNPVTNTKSWPTKALSEVAPESPSTNKAAGLVWVLNLDMVESQSGRVIEKVYDNVENLNSVAPFDDGNVLFSKLRPYLNKVVIPNGKGYATTELVPLRPKTTFVRKEFLACLLRSNDFVNYADAIATGTKMPRMPMTALRDFKCIIPPVYLQDEFIKVSQQADKSKYLS